MGHHTIKEVSQERFEFQGKTKLIPILLIIIGAVMAGIGSMQVKNNWNVKDSHSETTHTADEGHAEEGHHAHANEHHGPTWMTRVWANLLMNSYYFWLFAVAAIFFIAVNYVANAGWAVMLKRIMEAQSSYLLIGSILLVGIILGLRIRCTIGFNIFIVLLLVIQMLVVMTRF